MGFSSIATQIIAPYVVNPHIYNMLAVELPGQTFPLEHVLWNAPLHIPVVSFKIGHAENAVILKFQVRERYIKADYIHINDPVYRDSCVEFFIAFDDDEEYYNLEFNRLGTVLGAFGANRNNRQVLSAKNLSAIKNQHKLSEFKNAEDEKYEWQLALIIPFTVFEHHNFQNLRGRVGRCNFFKCGDDLPESHFLSWSPINNPSPDFHLPQFFGKIKFEIPN